MSDMKDFFIVVAGPKSDDKSGDKAIGVRLMHVGDSSIYLNWLLENIYNKVPNSNSVKNYELF